MRRRLKCQGNADIESDETKNKYEDCECERRQQFHTAPAKSIDRKRLLKGLPRHKLPRGPVLGKQSSFQQRPRHRVGIEVKAAPVGMQV